MFFNGENNGLPNYTPQYQVLDRF